MKVLLGLCFAVIAVSATPGHPHAHQVPHSKSHHRHHHYRHHQQPVHHVRSVVPLTPVQQLPQARPESVSIQKPIHPLLGGIVSHKLNFIRSLFNALHHGGGFPRAPANICRPQNCANLPFRDECCRTSQICCPLSPRVAVLPTLAKAQNVQVSQSTSLYQPYRPQPVPEHPDVAVRPLPAEHQAYARVGRRPSSSY